MTVYVVDGWDERTNTAFCEVYADEAKAIKRRNKIDDEYGLEAEHENMFFTVDVLERKVK